MQAERIMTEQQTSPEATSVKPIKFQVIIDALANNTPKLEIVGSDGKYRPITRLVDELRDMMTQKIRITPCTLTPKALHYLTYFLTDDACKADPLVRQKMAEITARECLYPGKRPYKFSSTERMNTQNLGNNLLSMATLDCYTLYCHAKEIGLEELHEPDSFVKLKTQRLSGQDMAKWEKRLLQQSQQSGAGMGK